MLELLANHKDDVALIVTSLVAIMSALANIIPKDTLVGKVIHFLALNLKVKQMLRTVVGIAITFLAKFVVPVFIFLWSRDREQKNQAEKSAENSQDRVDLQAQLNAMSDDDRRRLFDKWSSPAVRGVEQDNTGA